jgi:hypothetical protein
VNEYFIATCAVRCRKDLGRVRPTSLFDACFSQADHRDIMWNLYPICNSVCGIWFGWYASTFVMHKDNGLYSVSGFLSYMQHDDIAENYTTFKVGMSIILFHLNWRLSSISLGWESGIDCRNADKITLAGTRLSQKFFGHQEVPQASVTSRNVLDTEEIGNTTAKTFWVMQILQPRHSFTTAQLFSMDWWELKKSKQPSHR